LSLELLHTPDDALQHLDRAPGVAVREESAVGRRRELPARTDAAVHHEVGTLARLAKPESLELANNLEGEGVVELAHVDIARPKPCHGETPLRGASSDVTIGVILSGAAKVPAGGVPVRRSHLVNAATEYVHRRQPQVCGAIGGSQKHGAASFAGHGTVQKMKRVGDHT
jgi:hypothetical protein